MTQLYYVYKKLVLKIKTKVKSKWMVENIFENTNLNKWLAILISDKITYKIENLPATE